MLLLVGVGHRGADGLSDGDDEWQCGEFRLRLVRM